MLNYFNFHSLRNFIGVKERSIDQKLFSVYAFSFMRVCYYYYSNCVRFSISRRPIRSESSSWWVTIVLRSSPLYQKHTHTHTLFNPCTLSWARSSWFPWRAAGQWSSQRKVAGRLCHNQKEP